MARGTYGVTPGQAVVLTAFRWRARRGAPIADAAATPASGAESRSRLGGSRLGRGVDARVLSRTDGRTAVRRDEGSARHPSDPRSANTSTGAHRLFTCHRPSAPRECKYTIKLKDPSRGRRSSPSPSSRRRIPRPCAAGKCGMARYVVVTKGKQEGYVGINLYTQSYQSAYPLPIASEIYNDPGLGLRRHAASPTHELV